MCTKRTSILTVNSLVALSKVCSSRNSSDSIKTLKLFRNFSTATERSDLQNLNGYHLDNSSPDDHQNPNRVYSEPQNLNKFQQSSKGQSPDRPFGANRHGFYGGSSMEAQQTLNPNGGLRESPGNEFVSNPVGQNGNFSENYRQKYDDLGQSSNGFHQNSGGVYRERFRSEYQSNSVGQHGNFGGYYGQNNGNLQHNLNEVCMDSSRGFKQSLNGFHQNHSGVYRENSRNEFLHNPVQQNSNSSGYYGHNNGELQQTPSGVYSQNARSLKDKPNVFYEGNRNMNQNGFNSHSLAGFEGSPNGNYTQNIGQFQQSLNRNQAGNVGIHQNNPSLNQHTSAGQYLQHQYAGQYQPNSNAIQNRIADSQVSSNSSSEGDSAEASENSSYRGTLEELDGFCREGKVKEAVEVLALLEKQRITVDLALYLQLMQVCGEAKGLQEAKAVHEHISLSPLYPLQVSTYNRILEMYLKCGSMDDAFTVFNKMPERNLTSWDTMIMWLTKNDLGEDAIDMFTEFKKSGLKPDGQMFIGVFSACSVLGDIDEGMLHFESMSKVYGIVPSMVHYVSIVDILGSTGHLDEALEFIEKMPLEPSVDVWETLMNLCRVHGHMELGDRCAELVEQLDPSRLNEQSKAGLVPVKASDTAKEKEKKLAGQNLLEVRSRVHEYRAGDTSHPENDKIYAQLRGLKAQMKESGYIPETRFVLHDIDQESKEEALLAHSERLAVSYGLISSPARAPIRVIKNLRVCGDCHAALKIISKIVGRELIMRDAKRFHHFKDGVCSCRDYW